MSEFDLGSLSSAELRFLAERALLYGSVKSPGVRAWGESLAVQVGLEQDRRAWERAVVDAKFAAITAPEPPADPVGDVSGLLPWSEISS